MYRAPLRELRLVLHELLDDSQLNELPAYVEYEPALADSVLEEAARFAEGVLAPINRIGDVEGAKWTPRGVIMPAAFNDAFAQCVESG
jgi:acyl-CoA dehydrogenase